MNYIEEEFGILTDDNLYLDCILVKPTNMQDEDLRVLRVWVPKYPLTKSSIITCARQEVASYGPNRGIAHLTFDLRGTGYSDSILGNTDYDTDLHSIKMWAAERFGKINFGFLGFPSSKNGHVHMWPLRPGTMLESYRYPAKSEQLDPPTILYMSTYGNFSKTDEARCISLAGDGYDVYGFDPFRYLLHASAKKRLTVTTLREDLKTLVQMLPSPPIIIAEPLAAGLALLWTAVVEEVGGVIAIGKAQSGLAVKHIFDSERGAAFHLDKQIGKIGGRPLVFVRHANHKLGGDKERLTALFEKSEEPHRMEEVEKISGGLLLNLIAWIEAARATT